MSNLITRLRGQPPSAQTAKERLQFVLIHDRADVPPTVMEVLKDEIIAVISRHVDIDRDQVKINLTQDRRESRLVADIPLLPTPKRRRG